MNERALALVQKTKLYFISDESTQQGDSLEIN
jgi:hypothetical protein